jgi:hypothetical protein
MSFPWRLCVLICAMALCGSALAFANRAPVREALVPEPSPSYYISENIQFFPPGPEFKLQREAAAMKAYKTDLEARQAGCAAP